MPTATQSRSTVSWLVPAGALAVAAVLIAIVIAINVNGPSANGSPEGAAMATQVQGPDLSDAESRDEADLLTAGPVDAPVGLVVFSDYQCPFCARWSEQTLPSMMEHAEAGDLRIEWRDVNVYGPNSEPAARASYAAAKQGAFWQYHDELFADGQRRTERELTEEALTTLAGDLGLDVEQFSRDLGSQETADVIAEHQQSGFDLGATSTPVFILGGQPIVGAQPTEVFEDAFADALAAAE